MYTYIRTIAQLRKHIGQIVVSYYCKNSLGAAKEGWRPDDEIQFMWMCKLLDDGENYTRYEPNESIRKKRIFGVNHICLTNKTSYIYPIVDNITPHIMYHSDGKDFDLIEPRVASAQSYMRLATRDEIKLYNRLTRKRKILGHD